MDTDEDHRPMLPSSHAASGTLNGQSNNKAQQSPEITRYFTAWFAKAVSCFLILGFVCYHGVLRLRLGGDSCEWLLSDGHFQGRNMWQPFGCMIHNYSTGNARMCMNYINYWGGKSHISFVGDSRTRQQYDSLVSVFQGKPHRQSPLSQGASYSEARLGLTVEFLWQPKLNTEMYSVFDHWRSQAPASRPTLVIMASATGNIVEFNGTQEGVDSATGNLATLRTKIQKIKDSTNILWMLQDPVDENKQNISLVLTNSQIDQYDLAAIDAFEDSRQVRLWRSSRLVAQGYNKDSPDGFHTGPVALHRDTQILLNFLCNERMNYHDGTCCADSEPLAVTQMFAGGLFGLCFVIAVILLVFKRKLRAPRPATRGHTPHHSRAGSFGLAGESCFNNACQFFFAMARLAVILTYFFVCDRTNLFMKENKFYTHVSFMLPFLYLLILGVFFHEDVTNPTVLNRDQTEEMKGWMQLVILIYHVVGASEVQSIYVLIRVLVSCYIFLNAFCHFSFFWRTGNFSFHRLSQIMFRMNFLVVVLCFVMNRPYQFYTFMPLVSFWFSLIYIIFFIWPRATDDRLTDTKAVILYALVKIGSIVLIATLLYASEVLFEQIFLTRPWKALFTSFDDSIHTWRYNFVMDRYTPALGLLTALVYYLLRRYEKLKENGPQNLFPPAVTIVLTVASAAMLLGYGIHAVTCSSKSSCDAAHPYLAPLPILGFVMLRNMFGCLRARYSALFAWFGRISLELFVCHYHIWLSSDTHGVLVLVPGYPVLNVVITSFIFVCVSHEVHTLTNTLSLYLVPTDWKYLLRNAIIFLLALIPVAVARGMLP